MGRGDVIARSIDLFRPAGHGSVRSGHGGALPTLEQWADSITAVLDEVESREAVLVAVFRAFATGALFAATHPSAKTEKSAQVCWGVTARLTGTRAYTAKPQPTGILRKSATKNASAAHSEMATFRPAR